MRLEPSKRLSAGAVTLVGAVLTGLVALDIYVDWVQEGKPLASTVAENAVPLVLGGVLFGAIYWVYTRRDREFVARVSTWQVAGVVGLGLLVGWVVGFQLFQGELKPYLVVLQTSLGGGVAGTVVGVANARLEDAREAVADQRNRVDALFENAPDGAADVALVDGELVVERTNGAFVDVFGAGATGELAERPLGALVGHTDDERAQLCEAVRTNEQLETETEVGTDEDRRFFQVRVVPYGEDRGYVLYTDVTDLEETRQELEATVERVESSNEWLQQFAYVASHDLQEPLRMISSYVDLLATEYEGELDDEADEYIEYAVDGAERMQAMIDGLLDYSRVRSRDEEFIAVDAAAVFEDVQQDLTMLVADHDATVTVRELPTVEADENQLAQLFRNLVENALEHGGSEVTVDAERRNGEVVFSVRDNGPGIPKDQQKEVFDIFVQRDRDGDGTGMGLAICERIVDRHGGDIWVESTPGEGATFRFSLPA